MKLFRFHLISDIQTGMLLQMLSAQTHWESCSLKIRNKGVFISSQLNSSNAMCVCFTLLQQSLKLTSLSEVLLKGGRCVYFCISLLKFQMANPSDTPSWFTMSRYRNASMAMSSSLSVAHFEYIPAQNLEFANKLSIVTSQLWANVQMFPAN